MTDKPINTIKEESEREAEDEDNGTSSYTASPPNELAQAGLSTFANLSARNDSATNLSGKQISSLAASPEERSALKKASERDADHLELGLETVAG